MEWRFDSAEHIYASSLYAEIMALLQAQGAPDSDFSSAELIYGELIGNAIRHAHGEVSVRFDWSGEFPTLCVRENRCFIAPAIHLPDDPFAESGRGLFIIKALARDFTLREDDGAGCEACAVLPVKRNGDIRP